MAVIYRQTSKSLVVTQVALTAIMLSMIIVSTSLCAAVTTGVDKNAKLPYWELKSRGLSLRLVQRLPDQTRAFFAARGFAAAETELIAQSCIFQSVIKNDASLVVNEDVSNDVNNDVNNDVSYDLTAWKVLHQGQLTDLKTREYWEKEWLLRNVKKAARIAFEWSLLPSQQKYQRQDYNWGMSSFGLTPGATFDLTVVWTLDKKPQQAIIKNIECAKDIHPEPGDSGN